MPFSPDNPKRGRNIVAAVLAGTVVFSVVMAGYVLVLLKGDDSDQESYVRFLTILVVTLIPSGLGAWQAFAARRVAENVHQDIRNGVLKNKVKEAVAEVANGDTSYVTYSGENQATGTASTVNTMTQEGETP